MINGKEIEVYLYDGILRSTENEWTTATYISNIILWGKSQTQKRFHLHNSSKSGKTNLWY